MSGHALKASAALVASLVAWTVFAVAAGSSLGAFMSPVALSDATHNALAPAVAFDSKGNALVVWQEQDGSNWRIRSALRPKGEGFQPPETLSAAGQSASSPRIAFDRKGNAAVVWYRSDGAHNRVEAALRPKRESFGAPEIISPAGLDGVFPRLDFDKKGNALVVWRSSDGSRLSTWAAFRPRDGDFGSAEMVSPAGQDVSPSDVAFDRKGNAIVTSSQFEADSNAAIQVAWRPKDGSFEPAQNITGADFRRISPKVGFDKKRNAIAVWTRNDLATGANVVESSTRPEDGAFGAPAVISGDLSFPVGLGIDKTGTALAVWQRREGSVFSTSVIEGSWRPKGTDSVFGVPEAISPSELAAYEGTVTFNKKRTAGVAWVYYEDGFNGRIQVALHSKKAGSFGSPETVSESGHNSDTPDLALDKKDDALAAWYQQDGAVSRVYAAFRPHD